jgi:fatty-acyl-CoA synthase
MAAIKLRDGTQFDGEALAETLYRKLPPYAVPLFVRIAHGRTVA